jgi:hypothetical protein
MKPTNDEKLAGIRKESLPAFDGFRLFAPNRRWGRSSGDFDCRNAALITERA